MEFWEHLIPLDEHPSCPLCNNMSLNCNYSVISWSTLISENYGECCWFDIKMSEKTWKMMISKKPWMLNLNQFSQNHKTTCNFFCSKNVSRIGKEMWLFIKITNCKYIWQLIAASEKCTEKPLEMVQQTKPCQSN